MMRFAILLLVMAAPVSAQEPPPPPPMTDVVITDAIQVPGVFLGIPVDYCQATIVVGNHDPAPVQLRLWVETTQQNELVFSKWCAIGATVHQVNWIGGEQGIGSVNRESHYLVYAAVRDALLNPIAVDSRETEVPN